MTISGMTHEEAHEALEALALDALDASERAAVLAHVKGCAECHLELVALEADVAQLAYAVRPEPMSDVQRVRVRGRLLARAAADRSSVSPVMPDTDVRRVPAMARSSRQSMWIALAASIVAAVSLASLFQVNRERSTLAAAYASAAGDRTASRASLDSLRAAMADRDRLIANLTGPDVAVVTMASAGPKTPSARMFWDQSVNAWTFVAHNLPKPKAGRTYQLWLVTASQKISAGTFAPGANGEAVVRATYALAKDSLAAVAVTDEPEAGSAQPTTLPFIVGMKSAR
jgi:hypothetical protein